MSKAVGLEIHSRGIRAIEVAGRGRSLKIVRYADVPLHPRGGAPDPDELREALRDLFKGKFSKGHVVVAIEANETVVREIPVPFSSDDQIRKVVKYEAEHHLHDCDADDVIVQYTKVRASEEGTDLLVFAARKEEISRRIEYARGAGVEPLAMDLDAIAFYTAASAAGVLEDAPHCVLLNISHRSTEIVVVEDGRVRALRSVRMGVDSITNALARDMDLEFSDADERMKALTVENPTDTLFVGAGEDSDEKRETEKSHAELERDLFRQKRDELTSRLKREFVRSTAVLRTRPESVLVCGAGLQVAELLEQLGNKLGLPVEPFHPSEHFTCKVGEEHRAALDAGGVVPLGLALKLSGHDPLGLDFRREDLQVANKFELMKGTMALTVSLLFIMLMATSFYFIRKKDQLRNERFRPIMTSAYQAFESVAKAYNKANIKNRRGKHDVVNPPKIELPPGAEEALALKRYISELRRMDRNLKNQFGSGESAASPIRSAVGIMNDVMRVIRDNHKEIRYIDFKYIEIRQEMIRLKVVVSDAAGLGVLKKKLQELEPFKSMTLGATQLSNAAGTGHSETQLEFSKKKGRRR
ncbi:MAG: pilus assembly protein PilM [Planctomycetota bacterium]